MSEENDAQNTPPKRYNPRYVAYAAAYGMSVEEMFDHNKDRPGGTRIDPFVVWHRERIEEWVATFPKQRQGSVREYWSASPDLSDQYDAWLARRAAELAAQRKTGGVATSNADTK